MAQVFLSYSSRHRQATRRLAGMLAEHGYTVWWDHALESWGSYEAQITAALREANAVVVIWNDDAAKSDWVKAEAEAAHLAKKLINVRPTDMAFDRIPKPYNVHHIQEIDDREAILGSLATVVAGKALPPEVPLAEFYFRDTGIRLIDPKRRELAKDIAEISPTELLQARFEIVPYVDVTGARDEMIAWCAGGDRVAAGRLVHGPGGLGKTRLMIDVATELRDQGWVAGFVGEPPAGAKGSEARLREDALAHLIAGGEEPGLLMVLDYAEGRQGELRWLAEQLDSRPREGVRPVRLVLLTRSAGYWWQDLHDKSDEVRRVFRRDASNADVIALADVPAGRRRRDLFEETLRCFAPIAEAMAGTGVFPPHDGRPPDAERIARIETATTFARPLAIQMEALLHLAGAAPALPQEAVEALLDRVLAVERRHWSKLLGPLDEAREDDLRRGLSQVTAVGGVPARRAAQDLLMRDRFYKREVPNDVRTVVNDLGRVYASATGGIAPLEPDLIGEHEVATTADDPLIGGCLDWIDTLPETERGPRHRGLLTILQRATRPEHGAERCAEAEARIAAIIGDHGAALAPDIVAVMTQTPGATKAVLERMLDRLDLAALSAFDFALPLMHLQLLELALAVSKRHVLAAIEHLARVDAHSEEPGAGEAALNATAAAASQYGIRLSNLGRREEALTAAEEAVAIRRRLAEARPDAFLPGLAMSLTNVGAFLSNLGRQEEALTAAEEAVAIRRQLAEARPDAVLPDLASSLNNVGVMLSNLGRREEALTATEEAGAIYRQLAEARPDAFLPDLAMSLNNVGAFLSNLGRREEALTAAEEAVAIYRRLAEARPDAFLPYLAGSLNNVGNRLSDLGRREEALTATEEAVAIYRRLAQARPDAFLPDLARSLSVMAKCLEGLEETEQALSTDHEAVEILSPHFLAHPQAFASLMDWIVRDYLRRCESAGQEPDGDLVIPIVEVFQALSEQQDTNSAGRDQPGISG